MGARIQFREFDYEGYAQGKASVLARRIFDTAKKLEGVWKSNKVSSFFGKTPVNASFAQGSFAHGQGQEPPNRLDLVNKANTKLEKLHKSGLRKPELESLRTNEAPIPEQQTSENSTFDLYKKSEKLEEVKEEENENTPPYTCESHNNTNNTRQDDIERDNKGA